MRRFWVQIPVAPPLYYRSIKHKKCKVKNKEREKRFIMTLSELIAKLSVLQETIQNNPGVFMGNKYADIPVEDVIIENDYILIYNETIW